MHISIAIYVWAVIFYNYLMIHTLLHWKRVFGTACTLECSDMRLVGRDFEGTIFSGPGRIETDGSSSIRFSIYGSAADAGAAMRKMISARENPYDALEQFRLFATDFDGNEWTGGYTAVDFFIDHKHGWPLAGELQGLSTIVTGPWVAKDSSVELLFLPPFHLPMNEWMTTRTTLGEEELGGSRGPGRQVIDVLGTRIVFANDLSGDGLWLTADTSEQLRHPDAERWLSEPLRILMGSVIYPRLTARNFGNGSAFVTLLPAPRQVSPSPFGLMQPVGLDRTHDKRFWQLYADILSMVAAGDCVDMQSHEVTRLYEELWQAQRGSRWGSLLTFASTVEALAKSLMSGDDKRSEFSDDALSAMEKHLRAWDGDAMLRGRMLSNLGFVKQRSPLAFLRALARGGTVDPAHVDTWQKLRNSVMHGEMAAPWSTAEGDQHRHELIALVHDLTGARIARG